MLATNRRLVATRPSFSELRDTPGEFQRTEGYAHTLAEIWQQPQLWVETARRVLAAREVWGEFVSRSKAILLTGSGSSYFVGKCVASALRESTSVPVAAVESGELLMLGPAALPLERPLLVVSFARSGDSPESWGLVQHLLDDEPGIHHLLITCNPDGRLARTWGEGGTDTDTRVRVLMLDERSCDRSLVMTSSFTCMAVAGLGLGYRGPATHARYLSSVDAMAGSVGELLADGLAPLEEFPLENVDRMIAVGSGALQGAALEVSLKMLEMTDGRVLTRAEACLGLRHGPMCALKSRSLLFLPLSSHPLRRAYQMDLLKEVDRKGLGGWKVIVGAHVPSEILASRDLAFEMPGLRGLSDEWVAIASVVAGQLLAFLRCRAEGLRPDEPAVGDSITRVVGEFTLHGLSAGVS
jgi:tagatose-6-phosphate ketose/aldose isomerase